MNKIKRLAGIGLMMGVVMLFTSGCTRATPGNLLISMGKQMGKLKSVEVNMSAEMQTGGEVLGTSAAMNMKIDMAVTQVIDPEAAHVSGIIDMEILGQSESIDMEVYSVRDGEQYLVYSRQDGSEWQKEVEDAMSQDFIDDWEMLPELAPEFELAEELQDVEGEECYLLSGNINSEAVQKIMGQSMDIMGGEYEDMLGDTDFADTEIPLEIYITRKDQHPARMVLDMTEIGQAMFGEAAAGMSCEKFVFTMDYVSFNQVDEIVVPAEVEGAADAL